MCRIVCLSLILSSMICLPVSVKAALTPAEILKEAGPVIKKTFKYIDSDVADAATITYFSYTGATLGYNFSLWFMERYFNWGKTASDRKIPINPDSRFEDDLGYYGGFLAGQYVGKIVVRGRHNITDVVFPAIGNLGAAFLSASLTFCDEKTRGFGNSLATKLNSWSQRLTAYAHPKTQ